MATATTPSPKLTTPSPQVPTAEALEALVHRKMYDPVYVPLVDNRRQ
jgi:hypothetical protein